LLTQDGPIGDESGPFTRFDDYKTDFQGGFTASVDIYLDTAWALGSGFDYSVAASRQNGGHLRDFIFHVTKDTSSGQLLIGASNNTNFEPVENLEAGNHGTVAATGWYTFTQTFRDAGDGSLAVDFEVRDAAGNVVFTETRNDPADTLAGIVGGNRYGWFTNIDVAGGIAVDNVSLTPLDNVGYVNEDDLAGGNDGTAPLDATVISNHLGVDWGADDANPGAAGHDRTLTFTAQTVTDLNARNLTSAGDPVTFSLNGDGTELTATADALGTPRAIFTVSLSDLADGSYTFSLIDTLDHGAAGSDALSFDFGFTATDSDGDSVDGSFTVAVQDDVPVIGAPVASSVDEASVQSVAASDVTLVAVLDGVSYTFSAVAGSPFMTVTGGALAGPTEVTASLLASLSGGSLVGIGNITASDPNLSVGGSGTTVLLGGGGIGGSYRFSFADPADATALRDFLTTIKTQGLFNELFQDSPRVTSSGSLDISWGADNEDIGNGNFSQDAPGGTGDRSVTFTDATTAANNVVDATGTPLSLTSGGVALSYTLNGAGTVLTAKAGSETVFTVALDDDAAGSYRFQMEGTLDHPAAGADDLQLFFTFTATDSDGDTATDSFNVAVTDDVPVILTPSDSNLDADVLVTPDALDDTVSGSLGIDWGADDANPTSGSGLGDRAVGFTDDLTAANNVTVEHNGGAVVLTSNGEAVNFGFIGATLVGYTGGDVTLNQVFTVALNDATGTYDFTLLANLDYVGLASAADNVIDLSFDFTATDSDGDMDSGNFTVSVDDTSPVRVFDENGDLFGTYGTIAAGLAATADGYTVRILPGTYSESDLAVDHAITIIGQGSVVVDAAGGNGFVLGNIGALGTVEFQNLTIVDASGSGIVANGSTVLGTLDIDNVTVNGSARNGVEVHNNGVANVEISGSNFTNNGDGTSGGDGALIFYQYNGAATITNVTITGNGAGNPFPPAGPPTQTGSQTGIQFRGDTGNLGTVTIEDVTIDGSHSRQPIGFFNYDDVNGLTMTNVTVNSDSTGFGTAINFDGIGGNIDYTNVAGPAPSLMASQRHISLSTAMLLLSRAKPARMC
ncbi:MAG: hypothetical protein KDJ77_01880, partial [Rhodobiaceae bacterium]|nr:hypothetical protein [Rhodobiaceae bacterium]